MHDECEDSEDSDSKNSKSDIKLSKYSKPDRINVKKSQKNSGMTKTKHRKTNGSVSNNNNKKNEVFEQANCALAQRSSTSNSDQSFSESIKVSIYSIESVVKFMF